MLRSGMVGNVRRQSVSDQIDALLAIEKQIIGRADWSDIHQHGETRLILSVLVAGEAAGVRLVVKAYPDVKPPKFKIVLCAPKAVHRLDFDSTARHVNSLDRPADLPPSVTGHHYHSWEDNKRFSTFNGLPRDLLNARPLPANIQSFPNALRWFCSGVNLTLGANDVIDLPRSTRLV